MSHKQLFTSSIQRRLWPCCLIVQCETATNRSMACRKGCTSVTTLCAAYPGNLFSARDTINSDYFAGCVLGHSPFSADSERHH